MLERFRVRRKLELAVRGCFPCSHARFIRLVRFEKDVPGRVGRRVEDPVKQGGEQFGAFIVERVYFAVQAAEKFLEVADLLLFTLEGFFQLLAGIQGFVPLNQGGLRQGVRIYFLQGCRQLFNAFYFLVQPFLLPLEIRFLA